MDWFNELTAKLPRRNDAEPPGLREQIVAELRDHLECDFRREMITAGDEATAWQRVKTKFGNPAEVALRLWLDAMKGKLIMQKLSVAFLTALVCLCLVMIGFMWNNFSAQAEVQRESLAKISEQFKVQIDRLVEQIPKVRAEQISVAVPVKGDSTKFSLTLEFEGVAPTEFFEIHIYQPNTKVRLTARMQAGRTFHCDSLSSGKYSIQIFSPWGEEYQSKILIGPGRDNNLVVHTPAARPDYTEIGFRFTYLDNFKLTEKDRLLLLVSGRNTNRTIGTSQWSLSARKIILTLDWQGKVIDIKEGGAIVGQMIPDYFMKPEITTERKIISQNGHFSVESLCFAKLVSGEIDSGEYHYSSTLHPNRSLNSPFLHSDEPDIRLSMVSRETQSGRLSKNSLADALGNFPNSDFEIGIPEQFAEWYQKKDHFKATCEYFITPASAMGGGGGGGGGFF